MLVWPWIRDEAWNKDKAALRTDPSCLSWVLESAAEAAEEEAEADGNGTTCLFHWPRNACVSQWIQIQAEVASFLAESTCSFWGMRDTFAHSAALMFQEETPSFPTVNNRNTVGVARWSPRLPRPPGGERLGTNARGHLQLWTEHDMATFVSPTSVMLFRAAVTDTQPFAPLKAAEHPLRMDRCWQLSQEGCQAGPHCLYLQYKPLLYLHSKKSQRLKTRAIHHCPLFYWVLFYFKLVHFIGR